jgi:hypothetical protein
MNDYFLYLIELNLAFSLLYIAYRLFFEKDRNFDMRRIFLLGILLLPLILPLIPETIRTATSRIAPVAIPLEEITLYAYAPENPDSGTGFVQVILPVIYLSILGLGLLRLLAQFSGVMWAAHRSERLKVGAQTILSNKGLHASSFFGYVFMDPDSLEEASAGHILEHERVHHRQIHSADRIVCELFVWMNWFNPLAWACRRSLIQNLEYLADAAVVKKGTDLQSYQLSMIQQYIGSASITNQFSNQIKKRITMLNKSYKMGSAWKIAMLIPALAVALVAISCTDKESVYAVDDPAAETEAANLEDEELFFVVEEMPTFEGGEPIEFRKYIAQNLRYPAEAREAGITGKVFVKFVVTRTGEVVIPDEEYLAEQEGKELGEVVVTAFRTLEKGADPPDEKYIKLFKDEVVRVISESPDWEPGLQKGEPVNVMFTFPVVFAMQ